MCNASFYLFIYNPFRHTAQEETSKQLVARLAETETQLGSAQEMTAMLKAKAQEALTTARAEIQQLKDVIAAKEKELAGSHEATDRIKEAHSRIQQLESTLHQQQDAQQVSLLHPLMPYQHNSINHTIIPC